MNLVISSVQLLLLLQQVSSLSLASLQTQGFLNCANISLPHPSFIAPTSSNYTAFKEGERARIERHPAGIYYPKTEDDVINAVQCAYEAGFRVVPRGGGHSYESFSSQDDALVIDLCELHSVQVLSQQQQDQEFQNDANTDADISADSRGVAYVDGGARLGNVYIALAEHGFNFPGGTCPSVGIGGLIGGGGYGLIARKYGLASDSTLGMRVVLYNGTLVTASARENQDLFWALKGGNAGSFGIVTRYTIQVYKTPINTMFYLSYDPSSFPTLINLFMAHFPTIDRRLTTQLQFNKYEIKFWGQFLGPKWELWNILSATGVLNPLNLSIKQQLFRDDCSLVGVKAFPWTLDCSTQSDIATVSAPIHLNPTVKELGKFKADYASFPLPPQGARIIHDAMVNAPHDGAWIQFETILASRISDYKVTDSPYVNRQSLYSMQYTTPLQKGEALDSPAWNWIHALERDLKPFVNGLHYQNYPDLELGPDYGNKYYGADNFDRLKSIKAKYDPQNIFRNEQSIPLPLP